MFTRPDELTLCFACREPEYVLYGDPDRRREYTFDDRFYWVFGDGPATVPEEIELGLQHLRIWQEDFAREIVLLDFSSTRRAHEPILTDLLEIGESPTVITAEVLTDERGSDLPATGFMVGEIRYTPEEFGQLVRIRGTRSQSGSPLSEHTDLPPSSLLVDPLSLVDRPSSTVRTPRQSLRHPPSRFPEEFGPPSPLRSRISPSSPLPSHDIETTGVLGDLSLPFPDLSEW